MEIRNELSKYFMVDYDDTGSIGKRYRREDEIGTPYCITVDFDSVGDEAKGIAADNCVTVRDSDTMEQVRMPISELKAKFSQNSIFSRYKLSARRWAYAPCCICIRLWLPTSAPCCP